MDDIDLSGIDPTRHREARRRIALLEEYRRTGFGRPGGTIEFATRMGVSDTQFHRLDQAWHQTRDPTRLGLSLKRSSDWSGRTLPAGTREAVGDAIEALGVSARFVDIEVEARRRCVAACVPIASSGSVHQQLIRAREAASGRTGTPELLVAWTSLQLPLATPGGMCRAPSLLLTVKVPERLIVAHRLVVDDEVAAAGLEMVEAAIAGREGRIVIVDRRIDAGAGVRRLASGDAMMVSPTRSILSTWFGNRIGGLRILHRKMRRLAANPPLPIPLADAERKVADAIEDHNRGRSGRP